MNIFVPTQLSLLATVLGLEFLRTLYIGTDFVTLPINVAKLVMFQLNKH